MQSREQHRTEQVSVTVTFHPGGDVSAREREELRAQNAGMLLVRALGARDSWWERVQRVRDANDPVRAADMLAKPYAPRGRRRAIQYLLLYAASADDDRTGYLRMHEPLTVTAWTGQPEGRGAYVMGDAFAAPTLAGAEAIAARGDKYPPAEWASERSIRRVFDLAAPLISQAPPPQIEPTLAGPLTDPGG